MSNNQTTQTMTDDAKVAAVQQLAVQQKDEQLKKDLAALIEKYGPYAYDIVKIVQSSEAEAKLKQINLNEKMTTKEAISHFANQDVSTADLAKLFNQNELKIDANIAHYKETLLNRTPQTEDLSAQQQKLEQKVNDREPEVHVIETVSKGQQTAQTTENVPQTEDAQTTENAQQTEEAQTTENAQQTEDAQTTENAQQTEDAQTTENAQQTEDSKTTQTDTPSLETVIQQAELPPMTLDEYVQYYPQEDKPLTEQQLKDIARVDFEKGEGRSQKIYVEQPNDGSPTIGIGHAIFPKQLLDPNLTADEKERYGDINAYKEDFKQMKLYRNVGGKNIPLSAGEKGKIFEDLKTAVKNKTLRTKDVGGYNVIVSPASAANLVMLDNDINEVFNKDYQQRLNVVYKGLGKGNNKKGKEIFEKYPKELQLSLLHAYYVGTPGSNISKAVRTGKLNPENPIEVLTKIAQERTVGKDEALAMLQKMNPEAFSDAKIAEYKKRYNKDKHKSNSRNAPNVDAMQMAAAADSLMVANDARRRAEAVRSIPIQTVPVSPQTTPKINDPKVRMAMMTQKLSNQR